MSDFAATRHAVRFEKNDNLPSRDRCGEEADIIRALRRYSSDPDLRGERRVPIAAVASMCGLSRETVYQAMRGVMSGTTRAVLLAVIRQIDGGGIRFFRVGQEWRFCEPPDPLPPPQPRLVRAADWNEWARCQSCGGWRYTRVTMHGAEWHMCDGCLPWQTAGMGARPVEAPTRLRVIRARSKSAR